MGHVYIMAVVQPTQLVMPYRTDGFVCPCQQLPTGSLQWPSGTPSRDGFAACGQLAHWRSAWLAQLPPAEPAHCGTSFSGLPRLRL